MIKYEKHKQEVENRGYIYIGTYTKGEYTIDKHLYMNCMRYIRVKCPYCGAEYDVVFYMFKRGQNCSKCCQKYKNSFAYYIEQELKEPLDKYWDFEKNELNPYYIYKNSNKKVWIKCTKTDYHGSYKINCHNFTSNQRCPYCSHAHGRKVHPKDSFAQWGIDNVDPNFIKKYWSDKNAINPFTIAPNSTKKVWIKCQNKDYHNDYLVSCNNFYNSNRCPYCSNQKIHPKDSFGQWLIDTYGDNALDKYWSNKNTVDPFAIAPQSNKKVWIMCQENDYHNDNGGYEITCNNFYNGNKCPYCSSNKIHKLDSFGYLYPEKAKYWSKRNKKSPYEILPHSNKKYWFYCEDCGEEFESALSYITENKRSMKCKNCNSSKGEQKINKWLVNNNINFIPQKEFEGLVGLKGKNLSYDFYLPNYNMLIEYQGEFHDGTAQYYKGHFEYQQEHDRRKKQYTIDHNINLLEIWYWDFKNINKILEENLMKI